VEPEKLSSLARAALNDPAATIFVSAASGWEIATQGRLGNLPGAEGLLQDLPSLLQKQGFQPLAVQLHHGVHAGGYRQAHRDLCFQASPGWPAGMGSRSLPQEQITALSKGRMGKRAP
jgi:PIN domain nuclease of toxin-antitoxin system